MVTTCLVNLEMSGNLTAVREMSGILLKIREMSGEKSCQGKLPKTSVFFVTVRAGTAYRHLFLPKICFFSFFNVYGPHYSCTPSCALNHKLFRPELHCWLRQFLHFCSSGWLVHLWHVLTLQSWLLKGRRSAVCTNSKTRNRDVEFDESDDNMKEIWKFLWTRYSLSFTVTVLPFGVVWGGDTPYPLREGSGEAICYFCTRLIFYGVIGVMLLLDIRNLKQTCP